MAKKITRMDIWKQRFKVLFCKHHFVLGSFQWIDEDVEGCEVTGIMCQKCHMFSTSSIISYRINQED